VVAALRGRIDFRSGLRDDDSKDGTLAALQALKAEAPELRVLHHVKPERAEHRDPHGRQGRARRVGRHARR
jgi:hypothetical protein